MLTIYKYPFPIRGAFDLVMPQGATPIAAEIQGFDPCLWAIVDTDLPTAPTPFRLFGTGHPIDASVAPSLAHVDTFQQGSFVWHLFRVVAAR